MPKRPAMLNEKKEEGKGETVAFLSILLVLILFFSLDLWFYSRFLVMNVQGASMDDTFYGGVYENGEYEGGDIVYADSLAEARRGDVVIVDVRRYRSFASRGIARIIKRLIATGGDELYCENNVLYLKKAGETDFSPLEEDYVNEKYPTADFGPYKVGEGEIFVLGDHRNDSTDSRAEGCFREEDILAVVPDWAIAAKDATTKWEGFREAVYEKLAELRQKLASAFGA